MNHYNLRTVAAAWMTLCFAACSTNNGLKKFGDSDLEKEIPTDVAHKFEVKEVSELTSVEPQPVATVQAPENKRKKIKKHKLKKGEEVPEVKEALVPPMRRIDPMPFSEGEKLGYDIRYVGVTAATFDIEVLPEKVVNDHKVYHLSGHARTLKFFNIVYRVDDLLESFWDYDGLYSHRYTMTLDESKQERKVIELYDYDKLKSYYWNRVNHVDKGPSEQKEEFDIKPWSQDPLSLLYFLRVVKLPEVSGVSARFPFILDGKQWETVLTFSRKEKKFVGNREFMANVYKLENFQNGELKNKDNTVWISDVSPYYILRLEAKLKVGSFAIALDRIK